MLKKIIQIDHDINIDTYKKLTSFLKKEMVGYQPKKSSVLEQQQIDKFLSEAPDAVCLSYKLVLAMRISGGLRRLEIHDLTTEHIKIKGDDIALVEIPRTKTNVAKSFAITGPLFEIYKKYMEIRNSNDKMIE